MLCLLSLFCTMPSNYGPVWNVGRHDRSTGHVRLLEVHFFHLHTLRMRATCAITPIADIQTAARYDRPHSLQINRSQDEPPAASSFHNRERRAKSPNGRRRMEYARSQSCCACLHIDSAW